MEPSAEMVRLQRHALADAVAAGQLGPGADSDEALYLTSVLVSGVIGQAIANEPGLPWGEAALAPSSRNSSARSRRSIPRARPSPHVRAPSFKVDVLRVAQGAVAPAPRHGDRVGRCLAILLWAAGPRKLAAPTAR